MNHENKAPRNTELYCIRNWSAKMKLFERISAVKGYTRVYFSLSFLNRLRAHEVHTTFFPSQGPGDVMGLVLRDEASITGAGSGL